jgi:uncharacterized iron-regulated membrane protein
VRYGGGGAKQAAAERAVACPLSFLETPRSVTLQRYATELHRWTGLGLALFVTLLSATGALLVFRAELDQALNRDLFVVHGRPELLGTNEVLRRVAMRYPGSRPVEVLYGQRAGEAWRVFIEPGERGSDRAREVFVNPHDGTLLGSRIHIDTAGASAPLDRRSLMMYVRRIHFELLLGERAYQLLGVVALIWLVTTCVGLYLAWPHRGSWRRVLTIKPSGGLLRGLFDAHRSVGLLASIVILPVLISALWWNIDYAVRPLVQALLPSTGSIELMEDHRLVSSPGDTLAPPEHIIAEALALFPGSAPSRLAFDYPMGQYIVWLDVPKGGPLVWLAPDMNGGGNAMVTFGIADGVVRNVIDARSARAGDIYAGLQYPMHTGALFGLPGRLLWLIAGLAPILLAGSGVYVWLERRRRVRRTLAAAEESAR